MKPAISLTMVGFLFLLADVFLEQALPNHLLLSVLAGSCIFFFGMALGFALYDVIRSRRKF